MGDWLELLLKYTETRMGRSIMKEKHQLLFIIKHNCFSIESPTKKMRAS